MNTENYDMQQYQNQNFFGSEASNVQSAEGLMSRGTDDLWRQLLDTNSAVTHIRRIAYGYVYDDNTGQWVQIHKPMMNQTGMRWFDNIIQNIFSPVVVVSNMGDDDIRKRCKNMRNNLISVLAENHEKFDLDDTMIQTVIDAIDNNMLSVFSRGKDALQLKSLTTATKRLESYSAAQQQNNGGLGFGLFKGG